MNTRKLELERENSLLRSEIDRLEADLENQKREDFWAALILTHGYIVRNGIQTEVVKLAIDKLNEIKMQFK